MNLRNADGSLNMPVVLGIGGIVLAAIFLLASRSSSSGASDVTGQSSSLTDALQGLSDQLTNLQNGQNNNGNPKQPPAQNPPPVTKPPITHPKPPIAKKKPPVNPKIGHVPAPRIPTPKIPHHVLLHVAHTSPVGSGGVSTRPYHTTNTKTTKAPTRGTVSTKKRAVAPSREIDIGGTSGRIGVTQPTRVYSSGTSATFAAVEHNRTALSTVQSSRSIL